MPVLQTGLAKSAAADYTIDQSLRFEDGDSAYLSKTFAGAGNRKTWTLSLWAKRAKLGDAQVLFNAWEDDVNRFSFAWGDNDKLYIYEVTSSSDTWDVTSDAVYRDPGAWAHIILVRDAANGVAADRTKIYVNGSLIDLTQTVSLSDVDGIVNKAILHSIGKENHSTGSYELLDGYLAEVYFIDGTALDASSFGETDAATNQWKPIDASDLTFGTNGFYQKYSSTELAASFEDSSAGLDTFTTAESTTWTAPEGVTSVEYLVVGGGGGGGGVVGGGGGAGDFKTGTLTVVPDTSYTVTVGDGGAGGGNNADGSDGSSSIFSTITSIGGGGGGYNANNGHNGASGGGGAHNNGGTGGTGGSGTGTNGNDGGDGNGGAFPNGASGGGGGSGGAGGSPGGTTGGSGGAGTSSSISGSSLFYAAGGGGWGNSAGSGGSSIGGNSAGGSGTAHGSNATANRGSGGGGGANAGSNGGAGSAGIVILKYQPGTGFHPITANGDVTNTRAESKVGDSSIKFDGTGDFLTIPNSSDFHFGTGDFTIEFWVYQNASSGMIMGAQSAFQFYISSGTLAMYCGTAADNYDNISDASFFGALANDTWQHIAFVRSGTTFYGFVDGTAVSTDTGISATVYAFTSIVGIGEHSTGSYVWDGGYLDEIRISDSARYTSDFSGSLPLTPFTADSNTMLLIHSDFDGGLGADSSGNENDFTPTNLVATDQMVDSPTNNWCTLNPLMIANSAAVYSEGNLKAVGGDGTGALGTFMVDAGKWYFEILYISGTGQMGVCDKTHTSSDNFLLVNNAGNAYGGSDGGGGFSNNFASIGTVAANAIIGVALNCTDGEVTLYEDNVVIGSTQNVVTSDGMTPMLRGSDTGFTSMLNAGQDSSFAGNKTAQGNQDSNSIGDFYYEPPTDFLALCTSNLPSPEIALPTDHFNANLWTGTGGTRSLTGLGFQPDFTWIKSRSNTYQHMLFDSVRGATKYLASDSTDAEATDATQLTAFDSDGFSLGSGTVVNGTSATFVGWNWKAGTTFDPATAGTVTTGSGTANATAGFSVVKYTGEASSITVGHGLSQAPEMIIAKNLDGTYFWAGYHKDIGNTESISINDSGAPYSEKTWNDATPSASVFTLGAASETSAHRFNYTDEDFIAYCFHSVEGYSKVGSYEGNNNVDGAFVYCGFKPAMVITKSTSSGQDWTIRDNKRSTYNVSAALLEPNDTAVEATASWVYIDFVSNGFKLRNNNTQGGNYGTQIFIAFAESPFQYSNAR